MKIIILLGLIFIIIYSILITLLFMKKYLDKPNITEKKKKRKTMEKYFI